MTRNVTFALAQGKGTAATAGLVLTIADADGLVDTTIPLRPTATTLTVTLPVGDNYLATLTAYDSTGAPCSSPASVAFNVPPCAATAPPAANANLGNPTLGAPTLS